MSRSIRGYKTYLRKIYAGYSFTQEATLKIYNSAIALEVIPFPLAFFRHSLIFRRQQRVSVELSATASAFMTYPDNDDAFPGGTPDVLIVEHVDDSTAEPPLYEVLLHNDDYTTMEFVVDILMTVFRKTADEATAIMLAVHTNGVGVAGVYPRELAETKAHHAQHLARKAGYPLRCTLQEAGA